MKSFLGASLLVCSVLAAGCLPEQDGDEIDSVSQELTGLFRIKAPSGKCIDVAGASTADGAIVQQWACNGRANQQWRLRNLGGNIHEVTAVHSNKCLELPDDNTPVQQRSCTHNDNQQWRMSSRGSNGFNFKSLSTGKCLVVGNGSTANGARLVPVGCVSGSAQEFRFSRP